MTRISTETRCTYLNPQANKSRLYGLTPTGRQFQKHARREFGLTPVVRIASEVDWERYGLACFSHRAAIVSVLSLPLTTAELKRRIRRHDASARISCNNIRDALKVLCRRRVVRRVTIGRDRRTRYALTEACEAFPDLLRAAHWTREEQLDWRRP